MAATIALVSWMVRVPSGEVAPPPSLLPSTSSEDAPFLALKVALNPPLASVMPVAPGLLKAVLSEGVAASLTFTPDMGKPNWLRTVTVITDAPTPAAQGDRH